MIRHNTTARVETHVLDAVLTAMRNFDLKTPTQLSPSGRSFEAENHILMLGTVALAKQFKGRFANIVALITACKRSKARPPDGEVDTRVIDCLYVYIDPEERAIVTAVALVGMHAYIRQLRRHGLDPSAEKFALASMKEAMREANVATFVNATRKGHGHQRRTVAEMLEDARRMDAAEDRAFRRGRATRQKVARAMR